MEEAMNFLKNLFVLGAACLIAQGAAFADDVLLKPFILGSKGPGTVAEKAEAAKAALTANGFTVVGSALRSTTTEAADPSAAEIAALIDEIRAAGVPAIFAENVYNPGLMDQIAAEAGRGLAPPLYTDALGPRAARARRSSR
jgi:hypothetical protein